MSQELLYTSAPRGLKPGSRGFCIVVATQGMPPSLAERLESLSGYRHVFAPQDPRAPSNPVAWSHLRMTVGGRPYHVLSRVAAAGLDYTQRSNKIAHHVALDPAETTPAGPAALLSAKGFMQTDWDGETRMLPAGRSPPNVSASAGVCRRWQEICGDAGWAGVLAEAALSAAPKPVAIIYRPGVDVLPLMLEAISLAPEEQRWQITFSTYFTRLPPGMECLWRGLVEGSPEAQTARRTPGAVVVDLCHPLPLAANGPLVEAARTGVMTKAKYSEPAPRREVLKEDAPLRWAASEPLPPARFFPPNDMVEPPGIDLSDLPALPRVPRERPEPPDEESEEKPRWPFWLTVGGAAVLGAMMAGVLAWELRRPRTLAHSDPKPPQQATTRVPRPPEHKPTPVVRPPEPPLPPGVRSLQEAVEALVDAVQLRRWEAARMCLDEIDKNHLRRLTDDPQAAHTVHDARTALDHEALERKNRAEQLIGAQNLREAREEIDRARRDRIFSKPADLDALEARYNEQSQMLRQKRLAEVEHSLASGSGNVQQQLAALASDAGLLGVEPEDLARLQRQYNTAKTLADHWGQLPAAIDLGGANRAAAEGKAKPIRIPNSAGIAAAGLKLALVGGQAVCKAPAEFRLLEDSNTPAAPVWTIEFQAPAVGGPFQESVASLRDDADGIFFEWAPSAAKLKSAGLLQNCALRLASEGRLPRLIVLRMPQRAPDQRFPMAGLGFGAAPPPTKTLQIDNLPPSIDPSLELVPPRPAAPGDFDVAPGPDGQWFWINYPRTPNPAPGRPPAGQVGDQVGIVVRGRLETVRGRDAAATLTLTLDAGIRSAPWVARITRRSGAWQANAQFPPMAIPGEGETHWGDDGLKTVLKLYDSYLDDQKQEIKDLKQTQERSDPNSDALRNAGGAIQSAYLQLQAIEIERIRLLQAQWLIDTMFARGARPTVGFRVSLPVADAASPYRAPLFTTEEP